MFAAAIFASSCTNKSGAIKALKEYGKAAYFNILKGYNVRKHKWSIIPL